MVYRNLYIGKMYDMQIREATDKDIPEILKVLKASLGEVSSKKTEDVWQYKHIDNPFGRSLVFVAEENSQIIGVRAFMRWKWQHGEKEYCAFRAVDTATHPDYQGKGIFKKLTLKALEVAKEQGNHFIFNTPNPQSKPGYLKMGWREVNKLKIQLRPLNPLNTGKKEFEYCVQGNENDSTSLLNKYNESAIGKAQLFTQKDIVYLKWRYLNNPLQRYMVIFNKEYFIAGYVKKRRKYNEFRISEAITLEKGKKQAKSAILKMAKASDAKFLSISPNTGIGYKTGLIGDLGPIMTLKNISLNRKDEEEFLKLSNWNYSLGDLELF